MELGSHLSPKETNVTCETSPGGVGGVGISVVMELGSHLSPKEINVTCETSPDAVRIRA